MLCNLRCGIRIDTRSIATEAMHGGFCDPEGDVRREICNTQACPPIHCEWGAWVPEPILETKLLKKLTVELVVENQLKSRNAWKKNAPLIVNGVNGPIDHVLLHAEKDHKKM